MPLEKANGPEVVIPVFYPSSFNLIDNEFCFQMGEFKKFSTGNF